MIREYEILLFRVFLCTAGAGIWKRGSFDVFHFISELTLNAEYTMVEQYKGNKGLNIIEFRPKIARGEFQ